MGGLLEFQKELWTRVARKTREYSISGNERLCRAVDAFQESFPDKFRRVPRETFLARARGADWIFVGDYHSLPQAQLEAARLLEELLPETLALEVFPSCYQATLDLWSESDHSAAELLEMVEFDRLWGAVPRAGYETLLETARQLGIRLLAIDHRNRAADLPASIEDRDHHMARTLGERAKTPCMILAGDVHLSPDTLPRAMGLKRSVLFHQNHAPYYFRLLEEEKNIPALLQISPRRYVNQHTHPLLVEESFLYTLIGEEMAHEVAPVELMPDLLQSLAQLLGLTCEQQPTVLTTYDHEGRELLTLIVPEHEKCQRLLKRLIVQGVAFLGDDGPLLIHLPGSNHLVEAAGKWIFRCKEGRPGKRTSQAARFFYEMRLEAFGYLASSLVNPLRQVKNADWYVENLGLDFDLDQARRLEAALHRCWEEGGEAPLHRFPTPETVGGLVLSRCLGQALGHDLLPFWHDQPTRRGEILDALFHPGEGREAIQNAVARLAHYCRQDRVAVASTRSAR